MKTMQAVNATSKTDEVKASEVMFNNCWLGGSQMLQTDAILKMEAMATLGTMFGKCTRHLKKLVEAYRISDKIDEQEIAKGCALIRANFHVAPGKPVDGRVGDDVSAGVLVGKRTSVEPRKDIIQTFSPRE